MSIETPTLETTLAALVFLAGVVAPGVDPHDQVAVHVVEAAKDFSKLNVIV
jgi:hypothetical protein